MRSGAAAPNGALLAGLLLELFDDKSALDALVGDHPPIYLAVKAELGNELLFEIGTGLLDLRTVAGAFSSSGKVSRCCLP